MLAAEVFALEGRMRKGVVRRVVRGTTKAFVRDGGKPVPADQVRQVETASYAGVRDLPFGRERDVRAEGSTSSGHGGAGREIMQARTAARVPRGKDGMKTRTSLLVVLAAVSSALAGYAAGVRASRGASPDTGPTVATFAGGALKLGAVEASLKVAPEVARTRLATAEGRREIVEGLVRVELLARKGEERGYDRDPDFIRRYREEMGARYLLKEFEEPEKQRAPTDAEVRKYFDDHLAESSRPERARVALIAFLAEDPSSREQKRAMAQAALSEVKRKAGDYYAFGRVARLRSEDPAGRAGNGELPPLGRDELAARFGAPLADAVFAMAAPDLCRDVVATPRGFFVVKLLGRVPAYVPRFEDVRDTIRTRLATERRDADLKAFMDRLWKEADVHVDAEALKDVKL